MVEIAGELEPDYSNNATEWEGSPFEWIKKLHIKSIGQAGEKMVARFLHGHGFLVTEASGTQADIEVNGKRVEVKTATMSGDGKYTFNQIRNQRYDILLCLGLSPKDAHIWVTCKKDINDGNFPTQKSVSVGGYSFGPQHGGKSGNANTWMLVLPVPTGVFEAAPSWLRPQGGDLAEICEALRKMTSDGGG